MTHVSSYSSSWVRTAKLLGFSCGAVGVFAGLPHIPARHWVAFRQTIPVAMSLAEAEEGFKGLRNETRSTIEKIDDQSESGTALVPSDSNQLLVYLREHASEYKLLGNQYDLLSKQYSAFEAAMDKEFEGWSNTVDTVESSMARIKEHQKILARQIECSEKLAAAKADLELIDRVLKDGADIERLAKCGEHEMAIAQSLDGLRGLTTEVVAHAKRMHRTTQSVLLAWK
jgi:hypothetical protein